MFAVGLQPEMNLTGVSLNDETTERGGVGARDGRIVVNIGTGADAALDRQDFLRDLRERRADGIIQLNEQLAAVDRRDEFLADDAERYQRQRTDEGQKADADHERFVAQRPRQDGVRVPVAHPIETDA